jgi:hypothetical protein
MEMIMKVKQRLFVLIPFILCLSSATASYAVDIKTDYDRAADFSRYKTFCWQKVETKDPLWIDRIKTVTPARRNSSAGKALSHRARIDGVDATVADQHIRELAFRAMVRAANVSVPCSTSNIALEICICFDVYTSGKGKYGDRSRI